MKLLIVSQYFHPESFRINPLAAAMREAGHEVTVLTAQPNYPGGRFFEGYGPFSPARESYRGVDAIRVPIFPRGKGRWWELALNYLSFVAFAALLGLPRLRGRFDACLAFCTSPITAAIPAIVHRRTHGTPVAIWVQDLWPETFQAVTGTRSRLLLGAMRRLVRWIYRRVDQIWIQSPAYRDSVLAHGGRPEQIEFVPNWAEDLYDAERWSAIEAEPLPPRSVVFAGNLGRAQGLETLIETASLFRDDQEDRRPHFVFTGDGTLKPWLEAEVRRRGLERDVTFLPRRSAEEMPRLLKGAMALFVTLGADSVYGQTIPSKVQSCLASGRPIVASLFGEPARVLRESGAALVTGPGDPPALKSALQQLLSMSEAERERMGRNGHAAYRRYFTERRVLDRIEELLGRLSESGGKGAQL